MYYWHNDVSKIPIRKGIIFPCPALLTVFNLLVFTTVPPKIHPRILVVDDDKLICWALEREFKSLNFSTGIVENGTDALAELRKQPYGIVFLDINLPDMNGLDLLREIREISAETKVVIMSADACEGNRELAFAGGALQFLEKPLDLSEIHSILKSTLGAHTHKRKHPRHICRIPLRISIVEPAPEEAQYDLKNLNGTAADFGSGGLRLHTEYPLRVGQHVHARAEADNDHFRSFVPPESPARVVWVAPAKDGVMAGLQFVN
ncbi:MAG: response regulator [Desulfobacteria bacterium]